jgi:hypothetical protein
MEALAFPTKFALQGTHLLVMCFLQTTLFEQVHRWQCVVVQASRRRVRQSASLRWVRRCQ